MRKKIIYGVCMMGLVALVATSCKKNDENTNSFAANFGTFQAVIIDDDERAYIDPDTYLTMWEAEDQIKVFNFDNGRSAIYQTEANGTNYGHFVNNGTNGPIGSAAGYYAFYPAGMADGDFKDGYQTFTLGDEQNIASLGVQNELYALQKTSIPQAAYTENYHFNFNIIFGMARFKVYCGVNPQTRVPRYVTKIVVHDKKFNLHGTVTLKPNKIDTQKLSQMMDYLKAGNDEAYGDMWQQYIISHEGDGLGYSAIGGGRDLTINYNGLPNGGIELNPENPKRLQIGLRPGAFAYGFTIDIYVKDVTPDGEKIKVLTIDKWSAPNRAYAAEPAYIKTFNVGYITDTINSNYWPE